VPAVRALHAGLAPITIGLLLATGWILLEPAARDWRAGALAAATLALMLRTKSSPLVPIAAGALAGGMGWLG
jgi:chromate transporter